MEIKTKDDAKLACRREMTADPAPDARLADTNPEFAKTVAAALEETTRTVYTALNSGKDLGNEMTNKPGGPR